MRIRRARKMAEAQGTRSLIPVKGGCVTGTRQELLTLVSLTFWGFLWLHLPLPPLLLQLVLGLHLCLEGFAFSLMALGQRQFLYFLNKHTKLSCFNMWNLRPTEKMLQFTCETSLISFFSVLMFILSLLPNSSWCFNCIFSNSWQTTKSVTSLAANRDKSSRFQGLQTRVLPNGQLPCQCFPP